jgi:D-tagatose-1,6-bisphosphate aldolase subunit GatZ/KbaZ
MNAVLRKNATGSATRRLSMMLEANRKGEGVGVYSICSANRFVLEAAMQQARADGSILLLESTSSQVNQFGGYTGQTPAQFVEFVNELAGRMNFPTERIVFGGDHLGPYVWSSEPAVSAMSKAEELVRACVLAGYTKIHLDASMALGDDGKKGPPVDEVISQRATALCKVAEQAHATLPPGSPAPLYVIGTEVPVPGGELAGSSAPETTRVEDLERILELTRRCFAENGLSAAWERVIAVVVQPGVEFGDAVVFDYKSEKTQALAKFLEKSWSGVFEAHSTDYQSGSALTQMVKDHFAILKVGPWLTFALREAVFALASVEEEWLGDRKEVTTSRVRETLEQAMLADPRYWKNYYRGSDADLQFARKYSLSDRSRYYWPNPSVEEALQRLLRNLGEEPPPLSLLSQYLPNQTAAVRTGELAADPESLIRHKIQEVIMIYARACGGKGF